MKIIITGATGKIGREIALQLKQPGNIIILAYKTNSNFANKLKKQIINFGAKAKTIKINLSNNFDIKKLFKIKPDILIHSAGTFPNGKWGIVCKRAFTNAISQNLETTFFLLQEASKQMTKGKIVILTDKCTNKFYKNYVPYCLSKAGIEVLVKGVRHLLPKNLKVITIAPYIAGKPKSLNKKSWKKLIKKSIKPSEIARKICRQIFKSAKSSKG